MNIFILEDDPARMVGFQHALIGHTIHHAIGRDEAKMLWQPPYDLLLLDHDLGGEQMVHSWIVCPCRHHREGTNPSCPKCKGRGFVAGPNTGTQFCAHDMPPAVDYIHVYGELPKVIIHSYNPEGARNMNMILFEKGWFSRLEPFGTNLLNHLTHLVT